MLSCLTFSVALPANCEYVVNFAPELSKIIAEAKYLEKLGFQVPDLARSVALQEDKLIGYQDGLNRCLFRYHRVLASLSDAEVGGREIQRERDTERVRREGERRERERVDRKGIK